jgi:transposase
VSRLQVIDDQEHERVHDRVAAIDVAKDSGMVCTRTPHPSRPGARRSTVWTVKARMGAVSALGRQLARDGIEMVTLESTSDYWRIWFFVLETCGLAVQLVNASQAKNLPGRPKTDLLTELRGEVPQVSVRVVGRVATFPDHDHRRGATGSGAVGGAAVRVA